MLFHHWGGGADVYELEVDRERGTVLRLEARRLDQPFRIVEAEALEFEPVYPDGIFDELELPDGE